MSVVVLPSANQIIRQFADFPDVDMRFASKAAFETAIANVARIPDGWMAYCIAEKTWFFADKAAGTATAFGTGGGGGSSTFAGLTDDPRDNALLDAELDNIEALANEALDNVGDLGDLQTSNKDNLVEAINEVETDVANSSQDQITLRIFKVSNYGTL